jgi:5-formyltetrahydrofolate cyclo-ligase
MRGDKATLRNRMKEHRQCIPPEERQQMSRAISNHLLDLLNGEETVLVYASKPPEVDTSSLISRLIARGTRVVVPIIQQKDCSLRLSYLEDPSCLRSSTFSVPEPIGHEIPADAESITVAVIPLIGFDKRGNRLGYGAGYYDRFLSGHPGIIKIGLGFACQRLGEIPCDELDITMDYIVTEEGVIRCD